MIAHVVVFTYRGRVKKRDIRISRAFLDENEYQAILTATMGIFGPPDDIKRFHHQNIASRVAELAFDIERLSGRDSKNTSPS